MFQPFPNSTDCHNKHIAMPPGYGLVISKRESWFKTYFHLGLCIHLVWGMVVIILKNFNLHCDIRNINASQVDEPIKRTSSDQRLSSIHVPKLIVLCRCRYLRNEKLSNKFIPASRSLKALCKPNHKSPPISKNEDEIKCLENVVKQNLKEPLTV